MDQNEELVVSRGPVRVGWCNLGEGYFGDYDEDDPEDVNLLRFDVDLNGEPVDDASYCTQVPADTPDLTLIKLLHIIMNEIHDPLMSGDGIKRLCESLSWIDAEGNY